MKKMLAAVLLSVTLAAGITAGQAGVAEALPVSVSAPSVTQSAQSSYTFSRQVVSLVNKQRAKAGLKPLTLSTKLSAVAKAKAIDMYKKDYFDHNSPVYGSPFDMMKAFGVTFRYAGENIASGYKTPEDVMKAWMNSPGHRANIMNKNFTTIGMGYFNGEWVQHFTG